MSRRRSDQGSRTCLVFVRESAVVILWGPQVNVSSIFIQHITRRLCPPQAITKVLRMVLNGSRGRTVDQTQRLTIYKEEASLSFSLQLTRIGMSVGTINTPDFLEASINGVGAFLCIQSRRQG